MSLGAIPLLTHLHIHMREDLMVSSNIPTTSLLGLYYTHCARYRQYLVTMPTLPWPQNNSARICREFKGQVT